MATKKPSTAKKSTGTVDKSTTATTTTETVEVTEKVVEQKIETPTALPKVVKTYQNGDRITCVSITAGKLVYYSTKTKERYEWSNYGDTTDVLVEDLVSMKSSKHSFLFKPNFVITDEDFLSQNGWSKVTDLYKTVDIVEDAEDYINQTPEKLRQLLLQAPEGVKNTIKITASQMINSGDLYDIRIVKVIDEVLGTDFKSFMI